MKIEKISIKNFKIASDIEIDMSGKNGNLVFVNGRNGRGKTTFQDALLWCFYGDETYIAVKESKDEESRNFASRHALNQISEGDTLISKVSAQVRLDAQGQIAFVERSQVFQKQSNSLPPKRVGNSTLVVKTKTNDSDALVDVKVNPEHWLQQIFPKRLLNFFLFDGEKMTNFFKANVRNEIEKAIREIAGVDLFESVASQLISLESTLNKKIAKLTGPNSEKLAADLDAEKRISIEILKELNESKSHLAEGKARQHEINLSLGEMRDIQSVALRIEEIDISLEKLKISLDSTEREYNSLLLSHGVASMLLPSFLELEKQVEEAKKEDRLPPPFDPARIQLLINQGKCICGCLLEDGSEQTEQLHKVIERFKVSSDIGRILDLTSRESEKILITVSSESKNLDLLNSNIRKISDDSASLRGERAILTEKLQGSDVASIRALASEKSQLDERVDFLIRECAQLETQGLSSAAKIERLEKEFTASAKGSLEAEELRVEANNARTLANAALKIHQSAINQVRRELQATIEDKFKVVKQGRFKTEITENFEVLTLNKDGSKVALSEGENMAKAYVFSLALRDVVGLGFPLIVDTPFGRLSEDFRVWLADILAKFLQKEAVATNKQVIFLMTDTEYTPYTQKNFSSVKPLEYYLAYEKGFEEEKSNLGEGIDPEWLELTIWKAFAEGKLNV